jgi:hypothetical protein
MDDGESGSSSVTIEAAASGPAPTVVFTNALGGGNADAYLLRVQRGGSLSTGTTGGMTQPDTGTGINGVLGWAALMTLKP